MNKIVLFLPTILLASESDIVPRTANFIIFAVILYFLLVNHVKKIYNLRIDKIQNNLNDIEIALQEARSKKEENLKKVEKAKEQAEEIIELANKQAENLEENIINNANTEALQLEENFQSQINFEKQLMKNNVVDEVLNEVLEEKLVIDQKTLLDVASRKVS